MITTAKIPGKSKTATSQHNEMIKALSSKNGNLAVRLMRNHIRESLEDVLNNVLIHEDGV
jgi:DNA-binding GntR family transcriptional regulator